MPPTIVCASFIPKKYPRLWSLLPKLLSGLLLDGIPPACMPSFLGYQGCGGDKQETQIYNKTRDIQPHSKNSPSNPNRIRVSILFGGVFTYFFPHLSLCFILFSTHVHDILLSHITARESEEKNDEEYK